MITCFGSDMLWFSEICITKNAKKKRKLLVEQSSWDRRDLDVIILY